MHAAPTSPWALDPAAFPAAGSAAERLEFLVRYAVLAPSNRNTQPWRFQTDGDALELWADRSRSLPTLDPEDRALTVSCGAALYHLRLAAHHHGHETRVDRLPDPERTGLLARIRLGAALEPEPDEEPLFLAIPRRRTNRRPFSRGFVPWYLYRDLQAAAEAEGAWLAVVTEPVEKAALADLVADGDRQQQADPAFRAEHAAWVRALGAPERDGISGHALGIPRPLDFATPLLAAALRRSDRAEGRARTDHQLAEEAPALAVLGTAEDAPEAWLRAGEALAHVLLRATAAGVSASFLNQPIEVPALRARLAEAIARPGVPQVMIRLGFGPPLRPTARRPADVVVDSAEA